MLDTSMNFSDWISIRMEGEAAKHLDASPQMKLVGAVPMSRAGFKASSLPHGEYKPKNFDRYAFSPDEGKATQYIDKFGRIVRGDMLVCVEALAGYYKNDAIVKAFDDFLSDLASQNVKV
jgi:hypothetical protein